MLRDPTRTLLKSVSMRRNADLPLAQRPSFGQPVKAGSASGCAAVQILQTIDLGTVGLF